MKCQSCNGEATISFKEVENGELREIHLCEKCAAEKGFHSIIAQNKLSITHQFIWMAENLYPESAAKVGAVQCSSCGLRYSQFARTGRLGCAGCYEAFQVQLRQILRRVHGATEHKGGQPEKSGGTGHPDQPSLDRLREELTRAIEREEYEVAARLRDQIREKEGAVRRQGSKGEEKES